MAGKRRFVRVRRLPSPFLLSDVVEHLEQFTGTADDQLVFTGPKGAQLRRGNFTRQWRKAQEAAGLAGIHVHDLRHTGNTLAGEAGASLRELMDRMATALRAPMWHGCPPGLDIRQRHRITVHRPFRVMPGRAWRRSVQGHLACPKMGWGWHGKIISRCPQAVGRHGSGGRQRASAAVAGRGD